MLAYIFVIEGAGKIVGYAGVADYMQSNGVDGRLLPLVILTELGGGLLVLFGLWTRWAAIALSGYCLLTALIFHMGADQAIQFQKNIAMAGGFLALAVLGAGAWSLDGWRGRAGKKARARSAFQARSSSRRTASTSANRAAGETSGPSTTVPARTPA